MHTLTNCNCRLHGPTNANTKLNELNLGYELDVADNIIRLLDHKVVGW